MFRVLKTRSRELDIPASTSQMLGLQDYRREPPRPILYRAGGVTKSFKDGRQALRQLSHSLTQKPQSEDKEADLRQDQLLKTELSVSADKEEVGGRISRLSYLTSLVGPHLHLEPQGPELPGRK